MPSHPSRLDSDNDWSSGLVLCRRARDTSALFVCDETWNPMSRGFMVEFQRICVPTKRSYSPLLSWPKSGQVRKHYSSSSEADGFIPKHFFIETSVLKVTADLKFTNCCKYRTRNLCWHRESQKQRSRGTTLRDGVWAAQLPQRIISLTFSMSLTADFCGGPEQFCICGDLPCTQFCR